MPTLWTYKGPLENLPLFCLLSISVQPHRPTTNPNTSKFAQKYGGAEKCSRCGDSVYAAEKIIGAGKVGRGLAATAVHGHSPLSACSPPHPTRALCLIRKCLGVNFSLTAFPLEWLIF